jgi:hypothetical protein
LDRFLDAFGVQRALGVVSKKTANNSNATYLRGSSNDLVEDSERGRRRASIHGASARRKATGEALFAKFLPSSANQGPGGPPHRVLDFLIPTPPARLIFFQLAAALSAGKDSGGASQTAAPSR